ncbi:hypothetical protein AB0F59_02400 [Micromonospora lupini]|uniref:hypothetical protein n=1 Tax=Micromonospora lupini TaxID=285679 RepID=UPI0033C2B118
MPQRSAIVPSTGTDNGLPILSAAELSLMSAVDDLVRGWAVTIGATEIGLPSMLTASDLEKIDYFVNFPHLANVVTTLAEGAPIETTGGSIAPGQLRASTLVLPSAACYGAYFAHAGTVLDGPVLLTTRALCARAEAHYDGLRRLRTFAMREVIHLGTQHSADQFAQQCRRWITGIVERLGLDAALAPAADPFFDSGGSRALMQRLSKVKEEVLYRDGTAVSSVNVHRNFFGERCDIRDRAGDHVFTACFGAGLERWAHMLLDAYAGDAEAAATAVRSLTGVRGDLPTAAP